VLLVLIVGGVLASFAISKGGDEPERGKPAKEAAVAQQNWSVGQEIPVEITVLPEDRENLACASVEEAAGRHCAFENTTTPRDGGADDDAHILKPYATTGRQRFLAAGLWDQIKDKIPSKRFSVKCKYKVEAKIKAPAIRWSKSGPWRELKGDWFAGSVSGCTVAGS
jgi:hypothetical protein